MKLSHLTNEILLLDTKNLAVAERVATTKLLHHLKEIDRRKLFSDLKYSSLFDYCVRELGYSEGSAQRRIVAARMLAEIPEIEAKIKTGKLTLTNISQVGQFFKTSEERKEVLIEVEGLSKKACEKKLFELSGKEIPQKSEVKRVAEDKMKVALVLPDDVLEKLERLKDLLGYDTLEEAISYGVDAGIKEIEKKKFHQTNKPKKSFHAFGPPPPVAVGRVIRAKVKREVYQRDKKCTNCGSSFHLNYDHRLPYALGGKGEIQNIRILCFNCNQRGKIRANLNNSSIGYIPKNRSGG